MKQTTVQDLVRTQKRLDKVVKKQLGSTYSVNIDIGIWHSGRITRHVWIFNATNDIQDRLLDTDLTINQIINWIKGL